MKPNSKLPYLIQAIASVIFGFSFLMTSTLLDHLDIFQLLGVRFLIAAGLMSVLALTRVIKLNIRMRDMKWLLVLTVFQPVAYFISETYGVKMTSSSESGMMIALIPIAVAFISRWVLKEKLTPRQWGAVLLSVTGVMMIVGAKGFSQTSGSIGGYLLLLLAVISAALYSSISRKLRTQNTPYEITFVMMWAGAIVFNTIGLISAASSGTMGTYFSDAFQAETIFGVLYLGVLSSVVAFFCINYALSKVKASVSSGFANLTTVISVVAGVVIGGETILPLQIAGIVVILAALWWLATSKNNGRIRNNMQ